MKKMLSNTYGDSFFDGPEAQAMKGPLIGGGLTQLGRILVKKFMPSQAKHAPLIGMLIGGGVSGFLMTKPQHKEAGAAGLATALLIGLPSILDTYMGTGLLGDDLSAYTSEMGAYTSEMGAEALEMMDASPVQISDGGSGSTGILGAYTSEMGATPEGLTIQGSDFGSTGL
jgi:hypothetical protein